jgi:hypothetical protein
MNQPAYVIKEADQAILTALARFHYLTAAQAGRLLYPNLTDENRYVQRLLKRLVDGGYVLRLRALPMPIYGQAPHVFTLARSGREYVRGLGVSVEPYFRPSVEKRMAENTPFMKHRLAAVDVLIAASILCRDMPGVSCPQMLTERELKQGAIRVEVSPLEHGSDSGPRRVAVIPDGWFQLSINDGPATSIALELDRATEDQKVWREKVAAYTVWSEGPYQDRFETENLTIAVVCPDERRRAVLLDWTMRELKARHREEFAELFLFTASSPVETSPKRFFFSKVWREAGSVKPISILEPPAQPSQEKGTIYSIV